MRKPWMKILAGAMLISTLASTAAFAAGWEKMDSKWYYRLDDGTCLTSSWIESEDETTSYWVGSDGVMAASSWIQDGDAWYYAGADGSLLTSQLIGIDNNTTWYWVDEDGVMATNEWIQTEDGSWYYFGSDGKAYKSGWYNIEGDDYYFLKSSKLAVNALIPGGGSVDENGRKISY